MARMIRGCPLPDAWRKLALFTDMQEPGRMFHCTMYTILLLNALETCACCRKVINAAHAILTSASELCKCSHMLTSQLSGHFQRPCLGVADMGPKQH